MEDAGSAMVPMKQREPDRSRRQLRLCEDRGAISRTTGRSGKLIYAWTVWDQGIGNPTQVAGKGVVWRPIPPFDDASL
jgi:hypothetical protein